MKSSPEQATLSVRVHERVVEKKKRKKGEFEGPVPEKWANFALVFDCETTLDLNQNLTFLWWRFCELKNDVYVCQQEGVAYNDNLAKESVALIRSFVRGKRADVEGGCPDDILFQSRTEFVNDRFWMALKAGAVVVCFNAPFDLSRLAIEYREARNKGTGWSMVCWTYNGQPDKFKPRLKIKPKDSRAAFINLAGGDPNNRVQYRGRFLDLSVLGWSLRSRHMTLDGFLKSFGLKGKMKHEPTGRVTKTELKYGRKDVERTLALLNAMKQEYDQFPLKLAPERAMSAASITKAFLDEMNVTTPAQKFTIPDHYFGKCMQAYYGGRSEIRIRHQEMPIVVCDATSEYPSVAVLLKLWNLLTAAKVKVEECTADARETLRRVDLDELLKPNAWRELAFFAAVKPRGHVLPVRTLYSETGDTNIGLNPLTSDRLVWYAGPDLAASKLLGGQSPKVVQAFRLVPSGTQAGMKETVIGTRKFDPNQGEDDFFRAVIEERKKLPEKHPHYLLLKIIANSLYGVFAELNKVEYGKNKGKTLRVFSGNCSFKETSFVVERPGRWQFPPAAALITAGGRLMLAILECMVGQLQGAYLLTDTDSMLFVASKRGGLVSCPGGPYKSPDGFPAIKAIKWKQVEEICEKLNGLNPYDQSTIGKILKIEDCNYDRAKKQHQLYGLAVSAKRYVVYKHRHRSLEIIKPSEHGLGMVYVPDKRKRYKPVECKDQKTDYSRWIVEAWSQVLDSHFSSIRDPENALVGRDWFLGDLPAVMRIRVTTANVMEALRKRDPGAAKPYNFAISPILVQAPPDCTLIAPFSKHAKDWLTQDFTEVHSGDIVKLGSEYIGRKLQPQRLSGVVWRHYLHPEEKSLGPDGMRCGVFTHGLLRRRPIRAMFPFNFIGKEVERRAQEGEDISLVENIRPRTYAPRQTANTRAANADLIRRARRFSIRKLMRESRASQHAIERFLRGEPVHPATRARLARAVEKLGARALRVHPNQPKQN
jgi:hypothetical protein